MRPPNRDRDLAKSFGAGAVIDFGGGGVDAALLVRLLTGPRPAGVPALRLSAARVHGPLSLPGAEAASPVEFVDCVFDSAPDLRGAGVAAWRMERCTLPGFAAANLRVRSELVLAGCTVEGAVDLTDARLDGSLRLAGSRLRSGLNGIRIAVAGVLDGRDLLADGELHIPGARVEGNLDLRGARIDQHGAVALDGAGLQVGGNLRCERGFHADGRVVLAGATVAGDTVFSGATLIGATEPDPAVLVLPRGRAEGTAALVADRLTVRGNLELDAGFTSDGTVRLAHARVGGFLRLSGATLNTPEGGDPGRLPVALAADGIDVAGDLEARGGGDPEENGSGALVVHGQVRLVDAQVHGSASLSGSALHAPGRDVLMADRLRVGGALFLRRVVATGSIRLQNAHIGSTVDCTGAQLTEPRLRPDGSVKPSLDARVAVIGKDLLCSRGFTATGGVRLRMAEVSKSVNLDGAHLGGAGATVTALNAYGLNCQELGLRLAEAPGGDVRLTRATAVSVVDGPALWDSPLDLEDFRYESLTAVPGVDVGTRLRWLRGVLPGYDPDPYDQLAGTYRDSGHEDRSDAVLLAKQRHRHAAMGPAGRVWGWLQEGTVGYGYRPWLAAVWLAVAWLAGSLWFLTHRLPKLDADQNPAWIPVLYAADLLVPVVNLGQDGLWRTAGASAWVAGALTVVGWTLASTAAAGATRILTRR